MKNIGIAILTLALAACGSQPTKDTNSATLMNSRHDFDNYVMSAMFANTNGEKLKIGAFTTPNKATHSVAPGRTHFHAYTTLSGKAYNQIKAADFLFDAVLEAGKHYSITPSLKGACIEISLYDDTGSQIAGPFIQPWFGYDAVERLVSVMNANNNAENSKECQ